MKIAWLRASGSAVPTVVVVAGLLRYSWAFGAGWVLQALIVLSGLVVPLMWFLGAVFVLLWWLALHYGAKAERIQAAFRDHEGLPPS